MVSRTCLLALQVRGAPYSEARLHRSEDCDSCDFGSHFSARCLLWERSLRQVAVTTTPIPMAQMTSVCPAAHIPTALARSAARVRPVVTALALSAVLSIWTAPTARCAMAASAIGPAAAT